MKWRIATLVFSVIVGFSALNLSSVAYASDKYEINTADMGVSFTLTTEDITPPTEPENTVTAPDNPAYIINIPASISLNAQTEVTFTWANYDIESYEAVNVYIDRARTFPDGMFYLITGDGSAESQRIVCNIERAYIGQPVMDSIINSEEDNILVAKFYGDYESEYPLVLGRLMFTPSYSFNNVAGTYTGTIHFNIKANPYT